MQKREKLLAGSLLASLYRLDVDANIRAVDRSPYYLQVANPRILLSEATTGANTPLGSEHTVAEQAKKTVLGDIKQGTSNDEVHV